MFRVTIGSVSFVSASGAFHRHPFGSSCVKDHVGSSFDSFVVFPFRSTSCDAIAREASLPSHACARPRHRSTTTTAAICCTCFTHLRSAEQPLSLRAVFDPFHGVPEPSADGSHPKRTAYVVQDPIGTRFASVLHAAAHLPRADVDDAAADHQQHVHVGFGTRTSPPPPSLQTSHGDRRGFDSHRVRIERGKKKRSREGEGERGYRRRRRTRVRSWSTLGLATLLSGAYANASSNASNAPL